MTIGRAAIAIAALAFGAALLVPYENPSGEATGYAVILRDGGPTRINPNRLLIEPTIWGIHRLANQVAGVDPLTSLLWIARLTFVAYALLVLRIGSLLFAGSRLPLAIAAGCIGSYAMLWYGTDGQPVLLAHLPLLLGGVLHLRAWQTGSASLHAAAGVAYGLSVLFYISNVLPVGVVGLASLIAALRSRQARALIAPVIVAAMAGGGAIVAHGWSGSPLPVHQWVLAYGGGTANLSYPGPSLISLFRAVFGFGNSLVGARGAARLARAWTEGPESVQPQPGDAVEFALWASALAAAGWLTALAVGRLRRVSGLGRAVLAVCLGSALLVAIFNFLWIGSHPHFWVPAIPVLWIAWGFGLGHSCRRATVVALICMAILLPWNVFGTLRPLRGDPEPKLRLAELVSRTAEPCLIVTPGIDWVDTYGRYYPMGNRTVLSLWRLSTDPVHSGDLGGYLATVESAIDATLAAGHPVFVRGVIDERFPDGVPWREMEPRGFPLDGIQSVLAQYPSRPAFTIRGSEYRELLPGPTGPAHDS